jgi:hypothetical protein
MKWKNSFGKSMSKTENAGRIVLFISLRAALDVYYASNILLGFVFHKT